MKNNWISVKNLLALTLVYSALVLVTVTCSKVPRGISNYDAKPSLPSQPYVYLDNGSGTNDEFISDQMIQDDSRNSISDASVALGRVLFYDKRLSLNNTVACASCHKQNLAFADNVAFSSGFGGKVTLRNSMAILNPVFNNNMFGTIRMHQERTYPGRVSGTNLHNPDFAALARAYGGHGEVVDQTADFAPALARALAYTAQEHLPAVIELRYDGNLAQPMWTAKRSAPRSHIFCMHSFLKNQNLTSAKIKATTLEI